MNSTSPRSSVPEVLDRGAEYPIALIHFLLKEVEWIRKLASRLARRDHRPMSLHRDLECILELSGSIAAAMRRFLDEARCDGSATSDMVEVGTLVEQAVLQVLRRNEGHEIRVGVDDGIRCSTVPSQILVALVAVLENATDFSRSGEPVQIQVRQHGDTLGICIEDSGAGMEQTVVSACQARGFTTRPDGSGHGLGLYSAARIVAQNHGELSVESTPGEGTRVRFTLPDTRTCRAEPAECG